VDLYFICRSGLALRDLFSLYDEKYGKLGSNLIHIQKSLVYFDDAEENEMPRMLKDVSWQEVKIFFETEVRKLMGSVG
jgi:hypothetical protein